MSKEKPEPGDLFISHNLGLILIVSEPDHDLENKEELIGTSFYMGAVVRPISDYLSNWGNLSKFDYMGNISPNMAEFAKKLLEHEND